MADLIFRLHAIQHMAERDISVEDVRQVIELGELIREYPDDTPYPSRLILGWRAERPLHVVAADRTDAPETIIIITVYEPNPAEWGADFRSKKV